MKRKWKQLALAIIAALHRGSRPRGLPTRSGWVVIALMITNVALAVLTKAAPQLNIFAVGFPLTLTGGFIAIGVSLNYLAAPLQTIFEYGMTAMLGFAVPGSP